MQSSDKTILVTGCCGFIGYHLIKNLNCNVIGVDNLNDYYDVNLKLYRLKELEKMKNFRFLKFDIAKALWPLNMLFQEYHIDVVVHLAAQAGVRYSLENPDTYIENNIVGFHNLIKISKDYNVKHFIYASSSSVYGDNNVPFKEDLKTDKPLSLYAATKKSNELIAYTYSYLYNLTTTGLRFFTVYGPAGRPDMAYFDFTEKMINDVPIQLYNNGNNERDFTYIDDVVKVVIDIINTETTILPKYNIYNIGNNNPIKINDFVNILYNKLKEYNLITNYSKFIKVDNQPGDVYKTYANIDKATNDFNFNPKTSIDEGLDKFVKWYKNYKEEKLNEQN